MASRSVVGGGVATNLDVWFHDTITAHIRQYHGYNALRLTKPDGSFLGIAHPEEEFSFFDPRGAERNTRRNRALRKADRSAPDIDIGAELVKLAQRVPEVVPNVPRGIITVTQELQHQQALRPEHGELRSESEDERHRREIAEARDNFIRTIGRN